MIKRARKFFVSLLLISFFPPILFAESMNQAYPNLQEFLSQYLKDGLVNYQAIRKSPELLNRIFDELQSIREGDYE